MISVLLATYNGEKYIAAQLDSILEQTLLPDKIIITDDHSSDKTYSIVQQYQNRYPELIFANRKEKNSGSAKYNFMQMMLEHQQGYTMLCDQDDVWLPDKIELTFKEMQALEQKAEPGTPLLVHTDLKVVDEQLNIINPSLKSMIATAQIRTLKDIILQNHVTGCTVMYNEQLAKMLLKMPQHFVMHDWWLAMVAVVFAEISYIDKGTSLYRQHQSNVVGTQDVKTVSHKLYKLCNTKEIRAALFDSYQQAGSFLEMYKDRLDSEQIELLTAYSSLPTQNKCGRLATMKKYNLFRKGFLRKLSQIILG